MPKRVTIVLSDDMIKKLRDVQAKRIKTEAKAVSFSRVISEMLAKNMK